MLQDLANQYEAYPYPFRDVENEDVHAVSTRMNDLALIAHNLYGGTWPSGAFRALVAGGGTGDATVHLARQLADCAPGAEVVHLDLSSASLAVAQRRVERLATGNVRFVQGSLLDLPESDLGDFDYINCSGVLHHLPDPVAGARALAAALNPGGGMSLMLYGLYGRRGIYDMQGIVDVLRRPDDGLDTMVEVTRGLLGDLPVSNPYRQRMQGRAANSDDGEIVDMFLHVRDRPYTIGEVLDLLGSADLRLVEFHMPICYDPDRLTSDPRVHERLRNLPERQRFELGEILHGAISRHTFFARARRGESPEMPRPDDAGLTPHLVGQGGRLAAKAGIEPTRLARPVPETLSARQVAVMKDIDGVRTVGDILEAAAERHSSPDRAMEDWLGLYRVLQGRGLVALTRGPRPA